LHDLKKGSFLKLFSKLVELASILNALQIIFKELLSFFVFATYVFSCFLKVNFL
jgi:hypothetical protein